MSVLSSLTIYVFVIAICINLIFALMAFIGDRKSAINRIFTILSIAVSVWLVAMYFSLGANGQDPIYIKLTLFFAVPMNMLFFLFAHTLPEKTLRMKKSMLAALIIATICVMALTLSPWTFTNGTTPGIGLILFGLFSIFLNIGAIYVLIREFRKREGKEREQVKYVMIGILSMFGFIIATIFIPFVFFGISTFVDFFPLYTVLFLAIAAYAIFKDGLLDVKVLLTEVAVIVLLIILFSRIFPTEALSERILDIIVFVGVAIFGMILIRSVRREVEQREELQRLNEKIEANNKQLEELGRFKSELLSLASHQIRSPLAAMKGFITLIIGGTYGPIGDKVKDTLGKVQSSADELIGLINTLLDVRKVEEGKMEYSFEKVDLTQLITSTVEAVMPLATAKSLALTTELDPTTIFVNIDKEKFKQVVQNLVDNAIKYTPSGFVKVTLKKEATMAVIEVSDSGLGIPATLIPYLFEEFIRDERVKKEIRGTGLGLYIARKITEAHGGKLSATSPGEGKGSTFRVQVPIM